MVHATDVLSLHAAAVLSYWRHWPKLGWLASRLWMGNDPLGNLAAKPCVLACIWCISSCSICRPHDPLCIGNNREDAHPTHQ